MREKEKTEREYKKIRTVTEKTMEKGESEKRKQSVERSCGENEKADSKRIKLMHIYTVDGVEPQESEIENKYWEILKRA